VSPEIRYTNLDRIVFPADGITKGDVVDYYRTVAPRMLPHLRGRPLTLERFRATIDEGGFFQQSVGAHFPDWVGRVEVERAEGRGTVVHPVVEGEDALAYLANQGALTFHAWPARVPDLEHPDALVLDLDPPGDDFAPVRSAALLLREVLDAAELVGWPMTTGSRGIHVVLPLDGTADWAEVWEQAKALGAALVARAPQELTRAFYRSQRRGRLYVDTGRARRGHTAVVPYTVRARPGAPVATPLSWEEVEDPATDARRWTLRTVLSRDGDPWEGAWARPQSLEAAVNVLLAAAGVRRPRPPSGSRPRAPRPPRTS
jgi:bifunctional non-homologous end joining protein LigD